MNTVDQDTLLNAVRGAVNAAGGRRISRKEFLASSGMKLSDLFRHFPRWSDALTAAGFTFDPYNERIEPDELLTDWGLLTRNLQRIPTRNEYKLQGEYSPGVFDRNFGSWSAVPDAFRGFAAGQSDWADVLAFLPPPDSATAPASDVDGAVVLQQPLPLRPVGRRPPRLTDRPTYGAPIDFRGLRHAPVNEDGVIFLFGIVARELGYLVESVQAGFPDCEAKRQIGQTEWQRVRIEFEFESRNFRDHGHSPEGCDVIVCWVHNWPECPERLEVVELNRVIKSLAASDE